MSEKETPFIEKTCPLLDRKCIKGECVAYHEGMDTYYVSNGSEELEIVVPYKDGKRDRLLTYHIFEANIDEKVKVTSFFCKNYDKHYTEKTTETINEELFSHGEDGCQSEYKGLHVTYNNHNKDSKTAVDGKWEHKHNV